MAQVYGVLTAGSVMDADISPGASLDPTKMRHQYAPTYSQPLSTATTETRIIHVVKGATGSIVAFRAGSVTVAVGAATVTIDLKKNGTTCLSAVITLDTGNTVYVVEEAALSVTALAAGDVLSIVITATAGGGTLPTGVFAQVVTREDP
jgi:hypothetical protein